ncbi:hypothetical protein C8R43DRAFT_1138044 [Mycena crocata]|nr:hypothetical protein C8R43DRAFT_1138044 [Mycena crocata]
MTDKKKIPEPFERNAPRFDDDEPETLIQFLENIERMMEIEQTPADEKNAFLCRYALPRPRREWKIFESFGSTYEAFKKEILANYPSAREDDRGSIKKLNSILRKFEDGDLTLEDADGVMKLCRQMNVEVIKLLESSMLTDREAVPYFLSKLDQRFQEKLISSLDRLHEQADPPIKEEDMGHYSFKDTISEARKPPPRQQPSRLRVSSDPGSPPSLSSSPLSPPPSSPRLFTIATTSFSTPAPPVLPTRDANDDDSVDNDFITPPQRSTPRAPPPILPKSAARHPAIGTQAPLPIPKSKLTPASIPLPSSPPRRFMADSFVQFTGDRRIPNEPAAADVVKRLCAEFAHNPGMTDAEKIEIAGTRFRWNSPADRWYEELIARNPKPKEATVWTAFASAFKTRFKGTSAVVKPRGQLEAELSGMRITMAELSKGTIIVGSAEVHVLVDFVERVREAITESEAGRKDIGLWGFYTALPLFLKDAVGGLLPPTWEDMANMLSNVPQGKVDLATEQYRQREERHPLRRFHFHHRDPSLVHIDPAAANNGAKATAAQKEGLERVLRSCVSRMHPDTAQGRAGHRTDLATWQKKFGKLTRDELELETEGGCAPHPELPAHERSLRALGQTWLGKVDLRTVAPVNVVAAGPWYDDEQTENAGEAGFAEGLQQ